MQRNYLYFGEISEKFLKNVSCTLDTYKGELNNPLSLNRYVYVNNNPMIYYDPNGQASIPLLTSIFGGIFSGGATFVQDLVDDGKINTDWKKYAGNIIQGTATGFGLGLCGPACGGIGGLAGDTTNQYITKGEVDITQSLISGITTSVTAGAFNIGGQVTSTGLNYVKDYAAKGLMAGLAGDTTNQLLSKGIVKDNAGKTVGYDINKAITNYNPIQTIQTGITSSAVAPIGAKIVETTINKLGPKVTKMVEINGKKVMQDDKIFDSNYIDKQGRTNIQRMKEGLAPIGIDGKSVNLHHVNQTSDGPIAEMTSAYHQQNYKFLHTNTGKYPSKINRTTFNKWRSNYWRVR